MVLWDQQRRLVAMTPVVEALQAMVGPRSRCVYCEDSRATDVEHYWPKSRYSDRAFLWTNLLWVCTGCNRSKGDRFPLDPEGNPLLLDPSTDDPWAHLFYDVGTSLITARWLSATQTDERGEATLSVVSPINNEAVVDGRRRVTRVLAQLVSRFVNDARQAGLGDPIPDGTPVLEDFVQDFQDLRAYGLGFWFLRQDGREEEPFRTLLREWPGTHERVCERLF